MLSLPKNLKSFLRYEAIRFSVSCQLNQPAWESNGGECRLKRLLGCRYLTFNVFLKRYRQEVFHHTRDIEIK